MIIKLQDNGKSRMVQGAGSFHYFLILFIILWLWEGL